MVPFIPNANKQMSLFIFHKKIKLCQKHSSECELNIKHKTRFLTPSCYQIVAFDHKKSVEKNLKIRKFIKNFSSFR
jgi:hypothetical protein